LEDREDLFVVRGPGIPVERGRVTLKKMKISYWVF